MSKNEYRNSSYTDSEIIKKNKNKGIYTIISFIIFGLIVGKFVTNVSLASLALFLVFLVYSAFLPLIKEIIVEPDTSRVKYSISITISELPLWISVFYSLNNLLIAYPDQILKEAAIYGYVTLLLIGRIFFTILIKWPSLPK